jgi:hypothetical protein
MDVTHPHQCGNIRFVRLSREWISKEEYCLNGILSDATANDQIAAIRAMGNAFHV